MAVTLKDIAAATGLSIPTVSQILNHRSGNYCSEAKCKQVLKVARELGYRQRFADKIQRGDVTLNYFPCMDKDVPVSTGDMISLRHHGKAKILSADGKSKKGRTFVTAGVFI